MNSETTYHRKPKITGFHYMEDLAAAGAPRSHASYNLLHLNCLTVTGETIGERSLGHLRFIR